MKILAVNGSARDFGNSYNILNSCLNSFDKNNNMTELVQLSELQIKSCTSCYSCKSPGNPCVIQDDISTVNNKILESDLLIISSPIYMWQISALTKIFMERLYPLYHFDKPSELSGKKLILIFTQAAPDENMFNSYFEHVKASMIFLGFDVIDIIVVPGLRMPTDYEKFPDIPNKIKSLIGREFLL
ncbi:flavodoxin family protein [Acetobacterium fimetarium]|nr:flavodoxin family protein [Acetobacterium fimetarium]